VVVEVALQLTEDPVVALIPVAGNQLYVPAPDATIGIEPPLQSAVAPVTVIVGVVPTAIVCTMVPGQPPLLPVTVYTVVTAALQMTEEPVVALSPYAGNQLYVVAPVAVILVDKPLQ